MKMIDIDYEIKKSERHSRRIKEGLEKKRIKYLYRKKPVLIEAFQITKKIYKEIISLVDGQYFESCASFNVWPDWLKRASNLKGKEVNCFERLWDPDTSQRTIISIHNNLKGSHIVSPDDWIIKGVKGELYPCHPYIFEQTYEKV